MARIGPAAREDVPADQREAFDRFVEERGSVPATGPLSVMLNALEKLARGEHFRAYVRGDSCSLADTVRELAMLVTSRENDCQFIWYAHAAAGRRPGATTALRFAVAADTAALARETRPFTLALAAALGMLGLGLAAALFAQVRYGLRPLASLRQALAAVRAGRAARLGGDLPSEVAPLAAEVDALLDHNRALVERARNEAGNLAHALKTPLAVLANAAGADVSEPTIALTLLSSSSPLSSALSSAYSSISAAIGSRPSTDNNIQRPPLGRLGS